MAKWQSDKVAECAEHAEQTIPAPHRARVALETTLLLHGVPRNGAAALASELGTIVREHGTEPVLVGIVGGRPVAGLSDAQLRALIDAKPIETPKVNTATLGIAIARGGHGATTVSTTMEIAAAAGIRVFATGGLGGVHKELFKRLDISADLAALARFPVAVVTSGCKSILDVVGTRELLETLGVPVIGFCTDRFPAFYLRDGGTGVDARFDDVGELARFVRRELARTRRGIVIASPIPPTDELNAPEWEGWLAEATARASAMHTEGRDITPVVLGLLHQVSGGRTLAANIALVKNNAALAAKIAAAMA